jgi:hypothetical protein
LVEPPVPSFRVAHPEGTVNRLPVYQALAMFD